MRKVHIAKLRNGSVRWSHRRDPEELCIIVQRSGRAEMKSYGVRLATFHGGRDVALKELNDFENWLDKNARNRDRRHCHECDGSSFVGDRVCRTCEGTGRAGD
jgi:hypothetical protein